jgi:hypothetical protein
MKMNYNKKNIFTICLGAIFVASLALNITSFVSKPKTKPAQAATCGDPCKTNYNGLPFLTVKNMIYEYGNHQAKFTNAAMLLRAQSAGSALAATPFNKPPNFTYNDARSVYFEMDTIKQFICTIENIMIGNNLVKQNGEPIQKCDLGIKFYYAAYKNINMASGKVKQAWLDTYAGKHTLVLVATYRDSDNSIKTFDPFYFNTVSGNNVPKSMAEIKQMGNVQIRSLAISNNEGGSGIFARNHGELCPPGSCLTTDPLLP